MGAKGGKHVFNPENDDEQEIPLPGKKHLTRRLTDKVKNSSSSFHKKENVGFQYNPSKTPEITEVKINGVQSVYWRVKWPKRTISFQENGNEEQNSKDKICFKNLLEEDENNQDASDTEEQMTQRTVLSESEETSHNGVRKISVRDIDTNISKVQSYTNESFLIDEHDDDDQQENNVVIGEPSVVVGNEEEDIVEGDEEPTDVKNENNKVEEKQTITNNCSDIPDVDN